MKTLYRNIVLPAILVFSFISCEDFLDSEPQSSVDPDKYFTEVSQLQAYADEIYPRVISVSNKGYYDTDDQYTDNQIPPVAPDRFFAGQWKVPYAEGNWSFENIYRLNFFFSEVLPRFGEDLSGAQNTISGDLTSIRHYIGEMYTLRALEYFKRYQQFGDFPIITEPLPNDEVALIEASKRMPRSMVARFILSDLDKAITLLDGTDMATTRINRDLALLIKSRVALFEGTWLKYFKGTAFVPNGEGWPGKAKDYNMNFEFESGSIDSEINYFLDEAISASKEVAEKHKGLLTENTGELQQDPSGTANPYYDMYASEDPSSYPEVLLWRQYSYGVSTHGVCVGANQGNWAVGVTRGCVQNFLLEDGTPVYKNGTYADGNGYYKGDKTIEDVRVNRDSRLSVFLKQPGQKNILVDGHSPLGTFYRTEPYPGVADGAEQTRATTGYLLRKGGSFDVKDYQDVWAGFTGIILYRSVEALLNYMEAYCERHNGSLDNTAREYWQIIRRRAHVSDDIDKTIRETIIAKEAENDWGAYSGGNLLPDTEQGRTLYNIRRERRCELLSEGLRYMDVCRWRAMDQLMTTPYIPEGIHLWGTALGDEIKKLYGGDFASKVSPETEVYLRPYRVTSDQKCYEGYTWKMAHYLEPIMAKQFLITSSDGVSVESSPIYQNPYWSTVADTPAEK